MVQKKTEPKRIAASSLLNKLMIEAEEKDGISAVIATGDFNESHDESKRISGNYETAITFIEAEGNDVIKIATKDEVKENPSVFYNPWLDSDYYGSYSYNDSWETIDQFFLGQSLFDNKNIEFSSFNTVTLDFNTTSEGYPLGWSYSSNTGCSDHLPIMLNLILLE